MSQVSNGNTIGFGDAEAHMRQALRLLQGQDWVAAAESLQIAADLHYRDGHAYDEARCLQMAASALRSFGMVSAARELADRAASVRQDDPQLKLSIVAEQAEGAFEADDYEAALPLITRAIELAPAAFLKPDGINALLRRRARIYLALENLKAASQDYDRAYALVPLDVAGFVRTEQAGALVDEGLVDEAAAVLDRMSGNDDPHLMAEVSVLRAKMLRLAHCYEAAVSAADAARRLALEAVAPLPYFTASVEMAESLQSLRQRSDAYGALARAWATLGDLLGPEMASAWVEPCLIGFRARWGADEFRAAKREYEAKRRAEKENP